MWGHMTPRNKGLRLQYGNKYNNHKLYIYVSNYTGLKLAVCVTFSFLKNWLYDDIIINHPFNVS